MRRAVLDNLLGEYASENIDVTPQRSNLSRVPPRRLADNLASSRYGFEEFLRGRSNLQDSIPVYSAGSTKSSNFADFSEVGYHNPVLSYKNAAGDRFIPQRRGVNFDACHYHVTCAQKQKLEPNYFDLFDEIKSATLKWRRRNMEQALKSSYGIPGIRNQRILNLGETVPYSYPNCSNDDCQDEVMWKCRPRKRPLMDIRESEYSTKSNQTAGPQTFRYAVRINLRDLISWCSNDNVVAGLRSTLCICDVTTSTTMKVSRVEMGFKLCSLKCSNNGEMIVLCGFYGIISGFIFELKKTIWIRTCPCAKDTDAVCFVSCTCWSNDDKYIITGCNQGSLTVWEASEGLEHKVIMSEHALVALSMSPTGKHLVCSAADNIVKIYFWPSLRLSFEIGFFAVVKAFDWHPWSPGILCIGGGPGDGALSLWNMNSLRPLGYRKITFLGAVDCMKFNKVSAELVVQWFYLQGDRLRAKIPVLAGLDHVVDTVPIPDSQRVTNLCWNANHTLLATQFKQSLIVWDFFGNDPKSTMPKDKPSDQKVKNVKFLHQFESRSGPLSSVEDARRGKTFDYYDIR